MSTSFAYRALDDQGSLHRGFLNAESIGDVHEELAQHGLYPTYVGEITEREFTVEKIFDQLRILLEGPNSIARARAGFWRVVRSFTRRGREPADAVRAYLNDCPSPHFSATLRTMLVEMTRNGSSFAEALRAHLLFPRDQVEMIAATENAPETRKRALDAIVMEESAERKERSRVVVERVGSYITYATTIIAVIIIGKVYLPNFLQSQETMLKSPTAPPALLAMAAVGNFLSSWTAWLLIPIAIIASRQIMRRVAAIPEVGEFLERLRWSYMPLRNSELIHARMRSLEIVASMRFAGLQDTVILRSAAQTSPSRLFAAALLRQADAIAEGRVAFEESFALEPLWGGEIIGFMSASRAGSWVGDAQEMIEELREEREAARRLGSVAGTLGHSMLALALTGLVVGVIYISQFIVLINTARQL